MLQHNQQQLLTCDCACCASTQAVGSGGRFKALFVCSTACYAPQVPTYLAAAHTAVLAQHTSCKPCKGLCASVLGPLPALVEQHSQSRPAATDASPTGTGVPCIAQLCSQAGLPQKGLLQATWHHYQRRGTKPGHKRNGDNQGIRVIWVCVWVC